MLEVNSHWKSAPLTQTLRTDELAFDQIADAHNAESTGQPPWAIIQDAE